MSREHGRDHADLFEFVGWRRPVMRPMNIRRFNRDDEGMTKMNETIPLPQRTNDEVEWERAGAVVDTSLPASSPVTDTLLGRLASLPAGSVVLDLACGDGQPTFVLARERPLLSVLGVDVTPAMINKARARAQENAVRNVRFEVMPLDRLDLDERSMDAAVSQFGLLQEGDIAASARELARVLSPGAPFSIAAFDDMALNTLMSTIAEALAGHVPMKLLPDFDYLTKLAAPGLRERVLSEAGMSALDSAMFHWSVPLPSFDVLWQIATGPIPFARAFDAVDEPTAGRVRTALTEAAARYATGTGTGTGTGAYVFPMACRIFSGRR